MTQLVLLHSDFVHESVSFRALWGETGPIISDHGACVANAYPLGFQGYPSVLYEDSAGNKHILNLPSTLAEVLAWRDDIEDALLPPTLADAKAAAILQCEQGTEEYIVLPQNYPWTKQANIIRHEAARATAPPPAVETMYMHEDFLTMCGFIDTARTVCDLGRQAFTVCGSMEDIETVAALITSARECASLEELAPVMAQLETFIAEHPGA